MEEESLWPDPIFCACTCDHEPEEHGWGECEVEGCDCQGGWEE